MKRGLLWTVATVLVVSIAIAAALLLDTLYRAPAGPGGEPVRVTVERGRPFAAVVRQLSDSGLVRRPRIFNWYAVLRGFDRAVDVGTYEFAAGERPIDILRRLVAGDVLKVSVTVPEGFQIWEIAGAVGARAGIDSSGFVSYVSDSGTVARYGVAAPSLEGYLFPDTYLVPWLVADSTLVRVMVSRLRAVWNGLLDTIPVPGGMDMHEVLTLASIIEAEARLPGERALVSAVYHNRLARGMKLEADPTVAYAMGGYRGRLLYEHLEIDSPYNTYRYPGLPPGPICSPGRAAIRAALLPDSTCRALYFVARGDGSHIFSLTLKEHLSAVAAVRRQRARDMHNGRPGGQQ